jgi:hypothetical protein
MDSSNKEAHPNKDVPPFEVFLNEIREMYPEGDLHLAYSRIKWYIEHEKFCTDGTLLSYRFIMDQYAAHIRQWNARYRRKEQEGYLSKDAEEKRKDLYSFIGAKWYERVWTTSNGDMERDRYIFGNFTTPYLSARFDEFKNTIVCEKVHQTNQ